ncbi:hypothetical protein PoMZ_06777, partial [Pyricularia oryzae]
KCTVEPFKPSSTLGQKPTNIKGLQRLLLPPVNDERQANYIVSKKKEAKRVRACRTDHVICLEPVYDKFLLSLPKTSPTSNRDSSHGEPSLVTAKAKVAAEQYVQGRIMWRWYQTRQTVYKQQSIGPPNLEPSTTPSQS